MHYRYKLQNWVTHNNQQPCFTYILNTSHMNTSQFKKLITVAHALEFTLKIIICCVMRHTVSSQCRIIVDF